jgi:beta-lactamase superfamily II metal-dependent hydrolase
MAELKIWFLDVGHGDSAYVELPNGARMMIDCGCGDNHWPSTLLKKYDITQKNPVQIPGESRHYGLDNLIITHPHGDHLADIQRIRDEVGFYLFTGGYRSFIDKLSSEDIDFRQRGQTIAEFFFEVVKHYNGIYESTKDRVQNARPACVVEKQRFIPFSEGMDLNELSWFVSFSIGGHKVLFCGDMTSVGVRKILASKKANAFAKFVAGTTILKIPHHGRENGCSEEMFELFGTKPLACIASDEVLNERNAGTSCIDWYHRRTTEVPITVNKRLEARRVFTTRRDKDIFLKINEEGNISFQTNVFAEIKKEIYGG